MNGSPRVKQTGAWQVHEIHLGCTCLSIVVFYLTKLMGGLNTCILMKGLSVKLALLRHLHHGTILKNRLCRVMDELSLVDIVK